MFFNPALAEKFRVLSPFSEDISNIAQEKAAEPDLAMLMATPQLVSQVNSDGIHGQRGVSCADCHMPYKSEGGVKFSDHHIQSPLAMIDRTCQVCHRESEETLRNNVYERQRKANEIRNRLEQELAKAHIEAKFAWDNGAQKVFAGAVTDLCIRHIGKHGVHTVFVAVDRHDLMTQLIQFLRNMAAKTAEPDQKNRFHTCLLYPIAIFSCGRREWAGLLPNAA
jgi:hypothetical protein